MKRIICSLFVLLCSTGFVFAQRENGSLKPKIIKPGTGIRRIDFKNFNYGTGGEYCIGNLVLRKGRTQYGDSEYETAELTSVKYVDFDGDGNEEAFVVIDWSTSGSAGGGIEAYVFKYQNGAARRIWAKCNERSSAVLKGRSILFMYPEYVGNDAHCCPTYSATDTYAWKGSGLARISKTRKRN
jgi:hypothetical protein